METFAQIPDWFSTAVLGAIIAAFGYVAKLLLEWLGEVQNRSRTRRARLAELYSLLRAGKVAYDIQCERRNELEALIAKRDPEFLSSLIGYERRFAAAYQNMTDEEKELHSIIRTITMNTLRPLNESLSEWLRADAYFKAKTWGSGLKVNVAQKLAILEVHLLLWHAKFTVWIPEKENHALVYLADEEKHGVGFPRGIEDDVQKLLKRNLWSGS